MNERFILFHESDRLLRKGGNRRHAAALESAFRNAATETASLHDFPCLEGPVSVSLSVHGLQAGGNPELPPVVKAYLDALEEIVYADDRQIEHLVVDQAPWQHPWMPNAASFADDADRASVFIEVERLEHYTARYDRAFRDSWWRRSSPWRGDWKAKDEARLIKERRRFGVSTEAPRGLIHHLEEHKLRAGFLADLDRPGPPAQGTKAIHDLIPLRKLHHFLRGRSGSMLILDLKPPTKGTSAAWERSRDDALDRFAATRAGLPFEGFVALDIAVRGEAIRGKDLDNLVHLLLPSIEDKLCVRRGTVLGYRAYAAHGGPKGIQLRIIDNTRLRELDIALMDVELNPSRLARLERWANQKNSN